MPVSVNPISPYLWGRVIVGQASASHARGGGRGGLSSTLALLLTTGKMSATLEFGADATGESEATVWCV
jgi:hypothetical protein